ncbi:adhesion G protein-coupled receptor A3-like [Bufo gargarizans]|uniref:adhesion G protein-coupled receptor A3-like n=1 Tax=Bufo gargarizans TaxID=30331 RepID=UPI001CF46EA4|nr:adhesion G protein-coupled receptor A3-like [Bufo gargarizans]
MEARGLALLALLSLVASEWALPPGCKQDGRPRGAGARTAGTGGDAGKVVCSSPDNGRTLPLGALPNRTSSLILNSNKISDLKNASFEGLSFLERLDLRNNLISTIEPGAFWGLSSLKRLDLANNRIGCLNADIFKGLPNLVRLNLSGNLFSSLPQGTFANLIALKSLEFQTEYLLCDCNLLWMLQWVKAKNITVRETKCSYPKSLQGQAVTAVKPEQLTCDSPLELPSFYMSPSHRQVVFEGDSLPFQCMASYIDQDMQVLWYQDGKIVETDESQGIFVQKNMIHNCSLIASALTISNIQAGSTGNWGCRKFQEQARVPHRVQRLLKVHKTGKYLATFGIVDVCLDEAVQGIDMVNGVVVWHEPSLAFAENLMLCEKGVDSRIGLLAQLLSVSRPGYLSSRAQPSPRGLTR